ncbi:nucleoside triphosphate pyrophosphohydrolase [Candidatus Halobeggiatoa sp. HSG11]|nr:nucleoside triphosphate pyrophosphohydrolase [Candidatus Halobeggiatoa sp. HSG11]
MNPTDKKYAESLQNLLSIMNELRAKCPWDKKQTLESLRHLTIEETYELSDAILDKDLPAIKEELGDLMLHIVFYSKIAVEMEAFDIADVMNSLCDKLINRHPHVFDNSYVANAEEVKKNWELLKLKENDKGVLAGVPKSLPALIKAQRIQEKLNGVGFDWQYKEQVWEKVEEELMEFKQAVQDNNLHNIEDEFGDLLFSLVNYARFITINPETVLEKTNKKVMKRFNYIEFAAKRDDKALQDLTLAEMDAYWDEAKNCD